MADDEGNSHPPVFSKKRKAATRRKKAAKNNAIGAAQLEGLFAAALPDVKKPHESSKSTQDAFEDYGESMELNSASDDHESQAESSHSDSQAPDKTLESEIPTTNPTQPYSVHEEHDRASSTSPQENIHRPHDYSNEARIYMDRYDQPSTLSGLGRHNECREGFLDLLTEPRIPLWTRVQTLQMVATPSYPATAQDCLQKVEAILSAEMDADMWRTRLLKRDNNKMFADLNVWRNKNGLAEDLEGTEWGENLCVQSS